MENLPDADMEDAKEVEEGAEVIEPVTEQQDDDEESDDVNTFKYLFCLPCFDNALYFRT